MVDYFQNLGYFDVIIFTILFVHFVACWIILSISYDKGRRKGHYEGYHQRKCEEKEQEEGVLKPVVNKVQEKKVVVKKSPSKKKKVKSSSKRKKNVKKKKVE